MTLSITVSSTLMQSAMFFIVILSVVMLSVVMLSVVMLSVIMLSVVMLSVVMLSVVMLSVVMLRVVILTGVAPFYCSGRYPNWKLFGTYPVKLFYGRNLIIFVISYSVFPWQAFPD
jgi:hypothetical protein